MKQTLLFLIIMLVGCAGPSIEEPWKNLEDPWDGWTMVLYNHNLREREAAQWAEHRAAAEKYLAEMTEIARERGPRAVSHRICADGFAYQDDFFDFVSYPWVSIARKGGDCDDSAEMWHAILRPLGKVERVLVITAYEGHAMLLYTDPKGKVYLMSNLGVFATGRVGDKEDMIRSFFGVDTEDFCIFQRLSAFLVARRQGPK